MVCIGAEAASCFADTLLDNQEKLIPSFRGGAAGAGSSFLDRAGGGGGGGDQGTEGRSPERP